MGFFKRFFTGVKHMLIGRARLEEAFDTQIVVSEKMEQACTLWASMYENEPPWKNIKDGKLSLNLAKAVCSELARLATFESEIEVTGDNERAKYLNDQMQKVIKKLRNHVEKAGSTSGIVFKPYISGDKIRVAVVRGTNFYPTEFGGDGEIRGGIFIDFRYSGNLRYTRLEWHRFEGNQYRISNKAYKVNASVVDDLNGMVLGKSCSLTEVNDWATIEPETAMNNITDPLFSYMKMPMVNNIEDDSPLGVSMFAAAVDDIREADEQFSRIIWEYKAKEVAVYVSDEALDRDKTGKAIIPSGLERILRNLKFDNNKNFYEVFSPDFRDESLFNGLNNILRNIEFKCGLAYGTLSDVQDVEKTAEEVKSSKQRSFSTVSDIQSSIEDSLVQLLYAMDALCTLYNLAPAGNSELMCSFGDGVLEDIDKEFARRLNLVNAGLLRPELFIAWYFRCSEEEAKAMMPGAEEVMDEDGDEDDPEDIPQEE